MFYGLFRLLIGRTLPTRATPTKAPLPSPVPLPLLSFLPTFFPFSLMYSVIPVCSKVSLLVVMSALISNISFVDDYCPVKLSLVDSSLSFLFCSLMMISSGMPTFDTLILFFFPPTSEDIPTPCHQSISDSDFVIVVTWPPYNKAVRASMELGVPNSVPLPLPLPSSFIASLWLYIFSFYYKLMIPLLLLPQLI